MMLTSDVLTNDNDFFATVIGPINFYEWAYNLDTYTNDIHIVTHQHLPLVYIVV